MQNAQEIPKHHFKFLACSEKKREVVIAYNKRKPIAYIRYPSLQETLRKNSHQRKTYKAQQTCIIIPILSKTISIIHQNFAKLIEPFKPTSSSYCQRDIKKNLTQEPVQTTPSIWPSKDLCPCFHQTCPTST